MKSIIWILLSFCLVRATSAQQYWQQEVNYRIDVVLNDINHSLKGKLELEYINHSPDTLTFIWFHLWPNAYKNEKTALARQLNKENKRKLKNLDRGFIDSLDFRVDGILVTQQVDPQNIDVVKLNLTKPLLPGQKLDISTPFYVKIPSYFSRSGYNGQQYMICQWYPKPAVYDRKGWHPMPYLDQGEFYSEFGSFKVTITLPSDYVVGSTGMLLTEDELNRYKTVGKNNYMKAKGHQGKKKLDEYTPAPNTLSKTLQYYGENIHDFAWFADKDFVIQYDTLQLNSGKVIDVFSYYQPNGNREWINSISFIEDAVVNYSDWVGEYPYPVVAAVEGPKNLSSGGMEYPMITLITSPDAPKEGLDAVIAHEVGHNWFYGIVATNERDHPWMDEGINTYFQFRYEAQKYRSNTIIGNNLPNELKRESVDSFLGRIYYVLNTLPANKPIETSSTSFNGKDEYGMVAYIKTAIWMSIVEVSIGRENLDKAIKGYYNDWKFKHPYPEDMKYSFENATGIRQDNLFELLNKEGNFN